MRFKDLFKTAIHAITSNKLQAFLSMLGVIIGISSVVVVVAISEGAKAQIQGQIEQLGTNTISGNIYNLESKGLNLDLEDLYPMANSNYIDYVAVENRSYREIGYGEKSMETSILAVDSFYFDYKELKVKAGRTLNFADMESKRNFCVIGSEVAKEFFGTSNPIGQKITINYHNYNTNTDINYEYTVIGLLEEQADSMFDTVNSNVYIPITSSQANFDTRISQFYVIGSDTDKLDIAQDDARVYVEGLIYPYIVDELNGENDDKWGWGKPPIIGRPVPNEIYEEEVVMVTGENEMAIFPGGGWMPPVDVNPVQNYYNLYNTGDFIEQALAMITTVTLLISGIAAISLIVGGIGIANVMFMSVLERTNEIGLRKAIGARNIDITMQFLLESIVITVIGGIFGLFFGATIAKIAASMVEGIDAVLNINVMLVTFMVSVITGILAGFFPSRKASKLNPIDALRHE